MAGAGVCYGGNLSGAGRQLGAELGLGSLPLPDAGFLAIESLQDLVSSYKVACGWHPCHCSRGVCK